MRKIILLALVFTASFTAIAQDFSNKGKDFWVAYGYHQVMNTGGGGGNGQNMVLYFAADVATVVTVAIPGLGYTQTYNVAANTIFTTPTMPKGPSPALDARLNTNGLFDKGIHITSDFPIVAYAHIYNASVSGATLLLPTNTLGKEYYSINYTNNSNVTNSNCWFYVIATEPGTTDVEITPSANAIGHLAGVPFTVTLQQGQVYNVMGTVAGNSGTDLTGSIVKSLAAGNICKRIAVYSGSGRIYINCGSGGTSSDNYMVQSFPKAAWGKKYLTAPTGTTMSRNIFRVCVSDPLAQVKINGVLTALPLINNFYYEIPATNAPQLIESDLPITVAQYTTTQNTCGNGNPGDPEVIYLSSVEQNIKNVLFNSNLLVNNQTPPNQPHQHWVNAIIPNGGTALSSFRIDGNVPFVSFNVHPQDPAFSYIQISGLALGQHTLSSDSGFNAIAYGFATTESYGYNAGTNVIDLSKELELETTYGIETSPSICTNAPFKFKFYIPDSTIGTPTTPAVAIRFDSLRWDMSNPSLIVPNNFPIMVYPPGPPPATVTYDSITIKNGRRVTWYSLPTTYYFNAPGRDTLLVTGYTSTNEGCGANRLYDFEIQISDPPTASFNAVLPGCYLDSVRVSETTPQFPKTTYRQWWEFYDPVTNVTTVYTNAPPTPGSPIRNISHLFTTPGTIAAGTAKRIRHASITTPGCLSDTITQIIELPDIPDATIAGNTAVCLNSVPSVPVTFTGTLGTAEYVFTYNINGGAPIVSAPSSAGILIIPAPTNVPGTFVYNLVGVRNELPAGTPCTRTITGQSITVQINPLPSAAITGATTVCLNAPPPTVTFTGSNSTAPYTFAYTINGVAQTPIVSNAAGIATVTAPTNVNGTFIYEITQVTDASSTLCTSILTGTTTTITVQDLPNAAIASSTTAVCRNAAQPTITFTGSGGTAPYTFNYTINSVAQAPVVSNAAGVATLNVATTTVGTFIYEITQVTESSPQACLRAITGQISTVEVNPLPDAAIAGAVTVCLNSTPEPVVTFTGSNATAPYTFEYNINGVPQTPVVSNAAGIATVNAPTSAVGSFVYAVTQVTDGSSTACVRPITGTSTTVTIQDLPNGIIAGSTTAACLNSAPLPTITFTGSTGTAPYTFTYTINGTTQPVLVSNAAGVATITVPTNVATTYTYELTGVSEASTQLCSRIITGQTFIVVINPLPTASVSGATAVCRNAPQPTVTFTGNGATAPYTFEYTINGTAQTPLVSNAAGVATILASTAAAGTFTYQLTRVTDASSTLCTQLQNGSTVITINQLPVAAFNTTGPRCANSTITFVNTSTPNATGATTWAWDFGDPPSGPLNTSGALNPTHIYLNPNTAPGYTVTLTVTNSNGCISDPVASVNVIVNDTPRAGFIVPEVCINDVATVFTDTSSINAGVNNTINAWYWEFGDLPSGPLNTATTKNGTHLYPMPAIYQVTHAAINLITGCTDTIVQPITINAADPVSSFTVANSCSSDSVDLRNLSTVSFGNVTKLDIYWDNIGAPGVFETINVPVFNAVYRHKYPTLTTTQTYSIRMIAYSGNVCFTQSIRTVTVYATPIVQFNNIPNTCYLVAPFQLTQGSEIGGVPGTGTYSGPGITNPNGTFNPTVAGIGTHNIKYTWTASNPGACIDTLTKTIIVLDTAHAAFSFTLPSCEQVPTLFTNQSTVPGSVTLISTVWDFGDATGSQTFLIANPISHIYANPGTYTVRMRTVDNNLPLGCLSTDTTATINIDANHDILWDNTSGSENQPLCVNTSIVPIRYTLSGGATNVNFIPSLPPGLTSTVAGTPLTLTISGAPTTASNYSFDIETSGNTCVKDITTVTISVAPDHAIALRAGSDTAQSVCLNTPIDDIFYDLSGGATGVTIAGLPTGVTYAVTGNELRIYGTPTNIPALPGYTITTTGNSCLKDSRSGEIVVHPYPVPSFTVDKPSYCIPNAIVAFTNTTTPAPVSSHTYVWNFGDGSPTVNSISPTHWYTSGVGPFTVRLSATSVVTPILNNGQPGCNSLIDVPMTTIHPQPKADFVYSKPSVCIGDEVIITDSTDGMGGIIKEWHWDLGDGNTSGLKSLPYTFGDTITYIISMYSVNSFGCNSDTINKKPLVGAPYKPFTVYPYPYRNAGPDKSVLEGGSVQLDATAYAREPQYSWTPIQFLTNSKILQPRVVDPKTDMTYTLTVTGKGGCQLSDAVFVKLLRFPVIPNTFTPNNDGRNDKWVIQFLNTYPNNRVQIFTRAGNLIFESRGYNTPWDGTYRGKPMPFDTYYYIIEPGNGRDPITGYVTILK